MQLVGKSKYLSMLRRDRPHDIDHWAATRLKEYRAQDQRVKQATEEMSLLSREHPVMGPEEEELLREWAKLL